ncbi:hypothetical protein [Candidatus Vidania fulgoroideorum]
MIKRRDINYIRQASVERIRLSFGKKNDVFVTINKKIIKVLLHKKEIKDIKNICLHKGCKTYGRKIIKRGMIKVIVTIRREENKDISLGKREDLSFF